jgi:large subunit ribosomal protein L20
MPRAKRGSKRLQKRKKLESLSKGYFQNKSKLYRAMKEAVERGLKFAYVGRKIKKRDYRSLWIVRIGAGARLNGLNYSQFMHGLKLAGIELDRKVLADLAHTQPAAFAELAGTAKKALASGSSAPAVAAPKAAAVQAKVEATASVAVPDTAPLPASSEAATDERESDLIDVEGIGPAYLKKLKAAGIYLRAELLAKGATAADRKALADASGIGEAALTRWVAQIDLARIDGLSDQDAEILVAAGVSSAAALTEANPDELNARMLSINAEKNLVKDVPTASQIIGWSVKAKSL